MINEFNDIAPAVDFWSLRLVREETEMLRVREGVVQPPSLAHSRGVHITLIDRGAMAYAATNVLTREGLRAACKAALGWLEANRQFELFDAGSVPRPEQSGSYTSTVETPWESWSLRDKLALLKDINCQLKIDETIVDWQAVLSRRRSEVTLYTSDEVEIEQQFDYISSGYAAVANRGAQTQMRTGGGWGTARQGGLEQLTAFDFPDGARTVAEEAIALVDAPECPDTTADLLLMPSQVMMQAHESIGHPLELDRILYCPGDGELPLRR